MVSTFIMEKEIRFLSTKLRPVPATLPCFPFGHAKEMACPPVGNRCNEDFSIPALYKAV